MCCSNQNITLFVASFLYAESKRAQLLNELSSIAECEAVKLICCGLVFGIRLLGFLGLNHKIEIDIPKCSSKNLLEIYAG